METMMTITNAKAFLVVLSSVVYARSETSVTKNQQLKPAKDIQASIDRLVHCNDYEAPKVRKDREKLKELARKQPEKFVAQFFYYRREKQRSDKEAIGILVLMGTSSHWNPELRLGLIPVLEWEDPTARRDAAEWLALIDRGRKDGLEDMSSRYRKYLLAVKKNPTPGLVSYLYDSSPSQALMLFSEINLEDPKMSGQAIKPLLWANHIVSTVTWRKEHQFFKKGDLEEAKKELDQLSRHEGWYARRYVAEILRNYPDFGMPQIVERLKKDQHPLVSGIIDRKD